MGKSITMSKNQIRAAKRNRLYGVLHGIKSNLAKQIEADYLYSYQNQNLHNILQQVDILISNWEPKLPLEKEN